MKKLLSLLLVLTLLFSLAACGSSAASSAASAPEEASEAAAPADDADAVEAEAAPAEEAAELAEASAAEEEAAPEETQNAPLTAVLAGMEPTSLPITEDAQLYEVWAGGDEGSENDNECWAAFQERTGIRLKMIEVGFFAQSDQFNLIAASGDYPAVMSGACNLYSTGPDAAIEDEVFLNLADYLEEYAPHYYALITSNDDVYADVTTPEGNVAAFYSLYNYSKFGLGDKGFQIRADWLEKLGMEKPTTYDELHDALTGFKDELGATAAFALPASGMSDFVMAGFGVGSGFYVEDGTIKYGILEQGFKDYLQLINDWYSEGIIYSDFYSFANEIMFDDTAMIGSGMVGLYYNENANMSYYADYSDDPDFTMCAIAPVSKEKGGVVYPTEFTPSYADNSRWTITTGCEEPEIFIQAIDYLYTEEGILLTNYGIEGLTFEYDADGNPQYTDYILKNPDGLSLREAMKYHTIDGCNTVYDPLRSAAGYSEYQLNAWDDWTDANIDYSHALPSKDMLSIEEKEEYSSIYSDIETVLDEALVKFMIGDSDLAGYGDMVAQIEGMNIERCIEIYQQAYDRYVENH